MKRFLIIIIVFLIILAIGQNIYYKTNKKSNASSSLDVYEEDEKFTYLDGMTDIYTKYDPGISFQKLGNEFYKLIAVNLPYLCKNLGNKNIQ